jgi:hypothetical protein
MLCDSDPSMYSNLVEILKKEADEGGARKGASCSKASVWLARYRQLSVIKGCKSNLCRGRFVYF